MKLRGVKKWAVMRGHYLGLTFLYRYSSCPTRISIRTSIKISLNSDKTKIIYLDLNANYQITKYLNFRISDQKHNISNKVKYLGIQMEQHLDWNIHV